MKLVEKAIAQFSPHWAFSRARFRNALAAYEGAKPGRFRKDRPDNSSGDAVVGRGGAALRGYARNLEQNYDVAQRILDVMVQKIVGPEGISVEPLIRNTDGKLHKDFIRELLLIWTEWKLHPEVTGELNYGAMQRLSCRTWLRDGEMLAQQLMGKVPGLQHGTIVPFSLELIEADLLPFDYDDEAKRITQGIERNAWGRRVAFHIYKNHPGDATYQLNLKTKRVSADRMLHLKNVKRIRQARGVSVLASIIRRIEDLKDYEESERISARVDAALTAYIKKGLPESYVAPEDGDKTNRNFGMQPGMVFDGLQEGEEVGTIQSNRPSTLLAPFHQFMLRMASVSAGATYSSVSGDYNGSYSAQRQELVEGYGGYSVLTADFVNQFSLPNWKSFIDMAILSGRLNVPGDVDMRTLYMAGFFGPSMPWIDPVKEANGYKIMERTGYKSAQEIIRKLGGNPQDTMDQIKDWRDAADANDLVFDSDAKYDKVPTLAIPGNAELEKETDTETETD
ncbi:MAG: phage portal protein [Flavobacteriales bacterium]|nr:phage portal protein [Flavobacteriales bacterium]